MADRNVPPAGDAEDAASGQASGEFHGVGSLLKASRLRIGEDLHDVAADLRIRYPYLEAIEAGRYQDLPGNTYAVGFIRAYAEHLGLDGEEVLRRYKAEIAGDHKTLLSFPEPIPDTGMPGGVVVLIAVVLVGLVYGGWYIKTSDTSFLTGQVAPVPEELTTRQPEQTKVANETGGETVKTEPEAKPETVTETVPVAEKNSEPASVELQQSENDAAVEAEKVTEPAADEPQPETAATDGAEKIAEPAPVQQQQAENVAVEPNPESNPEPVSGPTPEAVTTSVPEPHVDVVPGTEQEVKQETVEDAKKEIKQELAPTPHVDGVQEKTSVIAAKEKVVKTEPTPEKVTPEKVVPEKPVLEKTEPVKTVTKTVTVSDNITTAPGEEPVETKPAEKKLPEKNLAENSDPGADAADNEATQVPEAGTTSTVLPSKQEEIAAKPEQPAVNGTSRIVIKAKDNGWIQIFDENKNQLLATRLLRKGDSYPVPDRSGLKLLTGKPGALEITVDGRLVPEIDASAGQQNGVRLDPELLLSGQATE